MNGNLPSAAAAADAGSDRRPRNYRPWPRGLAWLLFLGPFFFLSYGFANSLAASRGGAGVIVFAWEAAIPFLAWTIVPYWSIDFFYGIAFLFCRSRRDTDTLAFRLLTAQLISVACFLLFPLRFSFERPPTEGLFGAMFDVLLGFDKPFNQAPSLHIGLLVVLWARFAASASGPLRAFIHLWAALIAVSVLTTYQHHFIDLPTGLLVGAFCLWLWPDEGPCPLAVWRLSADRRRRALAWRYGLGAGLCVLLAAAGGTALWLLWPAVSLLLVALHYLGFGPAGFQKSAGRLAIGSALLLAPYLLAAWLNSRAWTRRRPEPDAIADGVWLGRLPDAASMRRGGFRGLVDLAAELPAPRGDWAYAGLPQLDLTTLPPPLLAEAAAAIERLRRHGPLLVCCALGYGRSASAVAAWLIATGRAADADAAIADIAARRPGIVIDPAQRAALQAFSCQVKRP